MAFLKELPDQLRTMIELDAFTGLRRGELIGLRWQVVDFENRELHIRRSVVAMVESAPKTEGSLKDIPLDPQTAESLRAWRRISPYGSPSDWLFASQPRITISHDIFCALPASLRRGKRI